LLQDQSWHSPKICKNVTVILSFSFASSKRSSIFVARDIDFSVSAFDVLHMHNVINMHDVFDRQQI